MTNLLSCKLKKLQAVVDITNYLAEHGFTYDEADDFLHMLKSEISASRTQNEFSTAQDWFNNTPCCDIGKTVVVPMNKINVCDEIQKSQPQLLQ